MRIPQRVRDIELPQFDVLKDLAARWQERGADVINLGQALPGFDPPSAAVAALKHALDDRSAHVYSADAGIPELRQALATALADLGADVDPEREIIITAGGNQAFSVALSTLVDPGDEVILPSPFFMNHDMTVRAVAATPVEAPTRADAGFRPEWRDIQPALTPRTTAVVLCSPSNPTGAVINPAALQQIVGECAERNVLVVVDETYLRFTYDSPPATVLALPRWRDNVVVVGSFSKCFAITGWRCGYLIAPPEAIDQAMKIHDSMVICAPVPVQRAVAAVLDTEPDYPRRWLPELRSRRDRLVRALSALPGITPVSPSGGFFVMARLAPGSDSQKIALDIIEHEHLVTIPGVFFGRAGEGHLRLSYGAVTEERLETAVARLDRYLSSLAKEVS